MLGIAGMEGALPMDRSKTVRDSKQLGAIILAVRKKKGWRPVIVSGRS